MPFASIYPADRRTHFFELVQNKTCTKICNTVYMVFKVQIDDSGLKTEHIHTQEYIMFLSAINAIIGLKTEYIQCLTDICAYLLRFFVKIL